MTERDGMPPPERVIRPRRSNFQFEIRRMWQSRDLVYALVRRDFVARYRQTILGPAWFIIQPLIATGAFTAVFSAGLKTSTDGIKPAFLFYLCGMLPWGFFSAILSNAGNTFQANAAVFTKVFFPRLIVPLAAVVGSLVPLGLQLLVFLAFYIPEVAGGGAGWHPDWRVLGLLPLATLQLAVFGLGVSLLTSGLSAKYRDLQHALPFLIQLWLFVTPVVYPLSLLGPRARLVAGLNPLTPLVEAYRLAFFGIGTVTPLLVTMSLVGSVAVLVAGLWSFRSAERTFADTV